MKYDDASARERSKGGRTAYGYGQERNGSCTVTEWRDGAAWRDVAEVGGRTVDGLEARFTSEQMARALCAGLENALPVINLAEEEAMSAIQNAFLNDGARGLHVLRENRSAARASGRQ